MTIAHTADEMIGGMTPELQPGEFVFVCFHDDSLCGQVLAAAVATYHEAEGLSAILPVEVAAGPGVAIGPLMRCITLRVHSALDGVGLTAAVAGALADAGIACNMVAAFHHDHAYVPAARAEEALGLLEALQRSRRLSAG